MCVTTCLLHRKAETLATRECKRTKIRGSDPIYDKDNNNDVCALFYVFVGVLFVGIKHEADKIEFERCCRCIV